MIGCIIVGGLAALGIASVARRHRWRRGWGCAGRWRDGGGPGCGPGGGDTEALDGEDVGEDHEWVGHHRHRAWFGHETRGPNPWAFRAGRMGILGGLFRRLETTPTQNQALRDAAKEFQESTKATKGEARRTRADLAAALRRSAIDAEAMGELFARHDSTLVDLRKAFVGLTMKVHDILDETQRERLAQLVERGPRWFRGQTETW